MVKELRQRLWTNDKDRELVRIDQHGKATIAPHTVTSAELRDLGAACYLAAKALDEAADSLIPTGGATLTSEEMAAASRGV